MEQVNNTEREKKILSTRMILASVLIITLAAVLVFRLYQLQISDHSYYLQESLGNQMRILPIVPIRGEIFDRNGKVIASNQLAYKLTLTPEKTENIGKTLQALKQLDFIDEEDISRFNKNKKRYKKFHSIPLKHQLSEAQVAQFLVSNQFVGVDIAPYFHRIYPNQEAAVHVVGYVSRMSKKDKLLYDKQNYLGTSFVGKIGIEKQYETLLHGNSGKQQIERNVTGRVINTQTVQPAENGKNLYLSIDLDLQKKAESLLKGKRGAVVVINVENGEILALVSAPTYNPNWFVNGISHKNYRKLQQSKDIPQFNRAIQGLYPPGSAVKPMIALAGLESGVIIQSEKTFCPGYYKLPRVKRKFNDWKRSGHGALNVVDSIAQSCDVFFYDLANKMGINSLHKGLQLFNFGTKTGIDIPGERAGVLPSKAWKKINRNEPWYQGETLITGIGQGFITTSPLQLALATAALSNKGKLTQPKLLKNIQSPDGLLVEVPTNKAKQIPIKNIENWQTVIDGMEQTIYSAQGTARRLNKNLKYALAGKTGTAQVFGLDAEEEYIAEKLAERLRDHALFVGFAPVEKPQVAIAVILENSGSGSTKAAPLAKTVLDLYFEKNPNTKAALN